MKRALLVLVLIFSTLFAEVNKQSATKIVANGKAVILVFESSTCQYCELLKKDFNENKDIKTLAKEFNIYFIDNAIERDYIVGEKEKKETTTTLRNTFLAKETPTIIMFDKSWNKIFQIPGYANPIQMKAFMKFIKGLHDGIYKTKDWQKFLKDNGVS